MASYSFLLLVGIECMQIIRIVCLVIDWLSDWPAGGCDSPAGVWMGPGVSRQPDTGLTRNQTIRIAAAAFNFDFDL